MEPEYTTRHETGQDFAILEMVSHAAKLFSRTSIVQDVLSELLGLIGHTLSAGRVMIYQNLPGTERMCTSRPYWRWIAPAAESDRQPPPCPPLNWQSAGLAH